MKKILILSLLLSCIVLYGCSSKRLTFSDPIVQKVINNVPGLSGEFSQSTIKAYQKAITESEKIYSGYAQNNCSGAVKDIIILANDLKFLKEHQQAITILKKFNSCGYMTGEDRYNFLGTFGFIEQDVGNKAEAVKYYQKIITEFSGNKYSFFGISQEEDLKVAIKELQSKKQ